jgi:hydrogenase maturation protein HypF
MIHSARLPKAAPARVLACGAYLKNTACLIDGQRVLWSAPHGDLVGAANREALDDSVEELLRAASGPVQAVAHDLHPDIYSTHVAQALAGRLGVPAIAVQHHHAHIAVVQAEQGVAGPVIGLALDGVGLGDDGSAWGGEVLWVDSAAHRWRRLDHLVPLLLPGGDVAAREPWRMAAAVLHRLGRTDEIEARFAPVVGVVAARVVRSLLERQVNSPSTTSTGRWFDAAAGALGLCVHQTVEAEAAIALEQQARTWLQTHPEFNVQWTSLDLAPLVAELFAMAGQGSESSAHGAAIFHLGLAAGLARAATEAARAHGTRTVILGGGCFLNQVLSERLSVALHGAGLVVLRPQSVSCGDAGLALGQAWVAGCTINAGQGMLSAEETLSCA